MDYFKLTQFLSITISSTLGILSVSKFFRENGFFKGLSTLLFCIVPIVFVKQIILLIYEIYLSLISSIGLLSTVLLVVFIAVLYYKRKYNLEKMYEISSNDKRSFIIGYLLTLIIYCVVGRLCYNNNNTKLLPIIS